MKKFLITLSQCEQWNNINADLLFCVELCIVQLLLINWRGTSAKTNSSVGFSSDKHNSNALQILIEILVLN